MTCRPGAIVRFWHLEAAGWLRAAAEGAGCPAAVPMLRGVISSPRLHRVGRVWHCAAVHRGNLSKQQGLLLFDLRLQAAPGGQAYAVRGAGPHAQPGPHRPSHLQALQLHMLCTF